nr:sigma-70 family RNA polymerase sigma factor [Vibrio fluminensis]
MKCLMEAWNRTESSLYHWLLKQTHNQHELEDIVQEVFLKAMSHSERFCTLNDGKSWLFKVAKNHFIDTVRRRIERAELDELTSNQQLPSPVVQLQKCLPKVLVKLDHHDRDIIESCDLNGMLQSEYAQKNQLSLPAVKSRLRRARMVLKQQLVRECKVSQDQSGVCCFKTVEVSSN